MILANTKRKKVMKFGEPTLDRMVTADGYMVGGAIMAPPGKIGLILPIILNLFKFF